MQRDVVSVARQLLGKTLVTNINGQLTSARITETEAYCGASDKACHAYPNKRTARTEVMFGPGGHAYIYLCYGIHHLFNIVTNTAGNADAVLIRAVEPVEGVEIMQARRGYHRLLPALTSGPGRLSKALGIGTEKNKASLLGDDIWLEDAPNLDVSAITVTTRIGVLYAQEDALLPWRFYETQNSFVSKR